MYIVVDVYTRKILAVRVTDDRTGDLSMLSRYRMMLSRGQSNPITLGN